MYNYYQELEKSYSSKSWESAAILGVPDHKKRDLLSTAYQFPQSSDLIAQYDISLNHVLNGMTISCTELKDFVPTFCNLHIQDYEKLGILTSEGYENALQIALMINNEETVAYSPFLMISIILLLIFLRKEEVFYVDPLFS